MSSSELGTKHYLLAVLAVTTAFAFGYGVGFDDAPEPAETTESVTCYTWVQNESANAMCFGSENVNISINPENESDPVSFYGNETGGSADA